MGNEKELSQFRALDFDAEDILFSSLVRYHFEREAAEDLEKLNAGEFDAMPEETDCARKRAEKYYRREQRLRILRHGYHVMQKVSVFLIVLIAGFTYLTISVDAVNYAVINWLTNIYQTHTSFHITSDNSEINSLKNLKINWIPNDCYIDFSDQDEGVYRFTKNDTFIGSVVYSTISQQSPIDMNVDTEDSITTYLNFPNFTCTMLIEMPDAIILIATTEKYFIMITAIDNDVYFMTTGEILNILQNIDY